MKRNSTEEAAKRLGISVMSLHRYIAAGKIPAPPVEMIGRGHVRGWTDDDIEKVRKILPKLANGRKTRYQKERAKKKRPKKSTKKK